MCRQNKQAKNLKRAAEFSKARKAGSRGPEKTHPKHTKVHTNFDDPETRQRRAAILAAAREARGGLPW